jgi:acido-empty-quinoprotein group A
MNQRRLLALASLSLFAAGLAAQGLDPKKLGQPPTDSWPTYNGDYTGRRFSPLKQIHTNNVKSMTLAWVYRTNTGPGGGGFGSSIKGTPLMVDGILYFTVPDHGWALDARTGRELWHHFWETKGGIHIGNRGFAMYRDWLFVETPDNYLVALNAKDGKERWNTEIADVKQEYFSTPAPLVIKDRLIVGTGGDSLDVPGYLDSRDPETGKLQWRWYTTPRKGEPGIETWPSEEASAHGGGMTWVPGSYDAELNLLYWPTGNPNPVMAGHGRQGDNLYTASIVALNPDTGKMVWYFQATPHDTHDWDANQTVVMIDGEFNGQPRKMLAQANRNGYFFLLDRVTGQNLISTPYMPLNWSSGVDEKGRPIPIPAKDPQTDGTLVAPASGGGTNWPPPSFSPDTGLFYFNTADSYSIFYLTDTSDRPQGYGGRDSLLWSQAVLKAIDYKTGKVKWEHRYPGRAGANAGILTTAGGLLFSGDPHGNFVAFNAADGKIVWHARLTAGVSNGPITYMLDGRQYVIVGAGDTLYAFVMRQ